MPPPSTWACHCLTLYGDLPRALQPYTLKDLIIKGMAAGRRVYKMKQAYVWLLQVTAGPPVPQYEQNP